MVSVKTSAREVGTGHSRRCPAKAAAAADDDDDDDAAENANVDAAGDEADPGAIAQSTVPSTGLNSR